MSAVVAAASVSLCGGAARATLVALVALAALALEQNGAAAAAAAAVGAHGWFVGFPAPPLHIDPITSGSFAGKKVLAKVDSRYRFFTRVGLVAGRLDISAASSK